MALLLSSSFPSFLFIGGPLCVRISIAVGSIVQESAEKYNHAEKSRSGRDSGPKRRGGSAVCAAGRKQKKTAGLLTDGLFRYLGGILNAESFRSTHIQFLFVLLL